jgi:hypothetical protein
LTAYVDGIYTRLEILKVNFERLEQYFEDRPKWGYYHYKERYHVYQDVTFVKWYLMYVHLEEENDRLRRVIKYLHLEDYRSTELVRFKRKAKKEKERLEAERIQKEEEEWIAVIDARIEYLEKYW